MLPCLRILDSSPFPPQRGASLCRRAVGNKLGDSSFPQAWRKSPVGPQERHHPFQHAVSPYEASLDSARLWVYFLLHRHWLLWDPHAGLPSTCLLWGQPPGPDKIRAWSRLFLIFVWPPASGLQARLARQSRLGPGARGQRWGTVAKSGRIMKAFPAGERPVWPAH